MNNEDKAKELSKIYAHQYHHNTYPEYSKNDEFVFSDKEINDACLEMAKWKDGYYKKLLDLLVKSGADPNIITDYIKNCIEP